MATKAKSAAKVPGRWEEKESPWYEQAATYCDTCGMLIPKRIFIVEAAGHRHRFCGRECAQLSNQLRGLSKAKPNGKQV